MGCGATDLVVLPEMFTTGFSMSPETIAEPADGPTLKWMQEMAALQKAVITGSVAIEENGKYYNRLYWVYPSGNFSFYNKRHLFRMGREDQHYCAGDSRIVREIDNWKICPLVCYDLRFPVWSRNRWNRMKEEWDYDVLVYVANWPEARSHPWKQLLVARAIENQCYVVGVNRIGRDGNDYEYAGHSMVIDPKGMVISDFEPGEEKVATIYLDRKMLNEFRKNFPVGMDADGFEIRI
jgi:predicted amidohydrolase